MKRQDIKTLDELEKYIEENRDVIYIREQVNGKWGAYNLNELSSELSETHIQRFLREGIIPVVLKRDIDAKL